MQQNKTIELSKNFKCDAKVIFKAISEGLLFKFTGANMEKSKFDFKTGGAINLYWGPNDEMEGIFTSIRTDAHVNFSWICLDKQLRKKIKTDVNISLYEKYGETQLMLQHAGFATDESANDHNWGWDDALQDLFRICSGKKSAA